ncbi:MAG: hypothetical protein ACLF0P_05320 [Thermoanaerobaculia bacterium]
MQSFQQMTRLAALGLLLLPAAAGAQVQRIELDIAGYLCGF